MMGQPFVLGPIDVVFDTFSNLTSKALAQVGVEQARPGQECTFLMS